MNFRRLGRAGMQVSEIMLGTWITTGSQLDEGHAIDVIRKAWDLGITTFDTADVYAAGRAEEILGKAIADLPREQLVICTKGHGRMWDGPNGRGQSRKHLMTAIEHSLKRLNLDYVDLYQVHSWDDQATLEEALIALDDIVRQGKALYIGCSNWSGAQLTEAMALRDRLGLLSRIDSIQPHYNMLDRDFETDGLPVCRDRGIGVVIYCPLAQGALTGKYNSGKIPSGSRGARKENFKNRYLTKENLAKFRALDRLAKAKKCTMAQLALAWNLREPTISSCIIGASRPEQVKENVGAIKVKLSADDLDRIEDILAGKTGAVTKRSKSTRARKK